MRQAFALAAARQQSAQRAAAHPGGGTGAGAATDG
jgi:hypothetical protein